MAKRMLRFAAITLALIWTVMLYQPATFATLTVDRLCDWECGQAYHYCVNNPDGSWIGYWINRSCQDNETWTFCDTWECPNSTKLYSHCLENPTLPDCTTPEPNEFNTFCDTVLADSCLYDCQHDSRGTCVQSHVSGNGSATCTCVYVLVT
jgi:hypothetical protein